MATRLLTCLAVAVTILAAPAAQSSSNGGSATMSPSVVGSYFVSRDGNDVATLELVVLWRGSPGWFMRSNGFASEHGLSPLPGRVYDIRQGGVRLTMSFNAATRVARVLDQDVPLTNGANVILVDDVDGPSGPRVVKTLKVNGALGSNRVLNYLILDTPELLDYMRCLSHIAGPQNGGPINYVCSSAIATGKVTGT